MAQRTGATRVIRMRLVAGHATDPLVHAGRRAVVACASLAEGIGRMALRAEPLARISRDFYGPLQFENPCDRKVVDRKVLFLLTHIESDRVTTAPSGARFENK